ncbi:uncharacterized protein [Haliotis asinina]|uniref:uncharacterized protein n=1 Tax=Haliotis asinina TaxID=109174 RepID=UPI0035322076
MESNQNDAVTCGMKTKPQSYVIFDTETTGLPGPYGNPKITELCLLGIHRDDMFEDGVAVPRIVNKLRLCLNPRKQVSPGSSMLTGLFNDALDRQHPFNSEIVAVIRGFLETQAHPTCLIAHNGDKFDFPLLAAQLRKVNESLPHDMLCADSLLAFREIDPPTERPMSPAEVRGQTWEVSEVTPGKRQNSDEQLHIPKKPKKDFDQTQSLFENIRRGKAARQLYKDEAYSSVTEHKVSPDKAVSLSGEDYVEASSSSVRNNSKSSVPTVPVFRNVCNVMPMVQEDVSNCPSLSQDTSVTVHNVRSDKMASETENHTNSINSTILSQDTSNPQTRNMCIRTGSEAGHQQTPSQPDAATTELHISVSTTIKDTETQLDSQGSILDDDLVLAITQIEADNSLDHSSMKRSDSDRSTLCLSHATPLKSSGARNPSIGSLGSSDTQNVIKSISSSESNPGSSDFEPMNSSNALNSNIGLMGSSDATNSNGGPIYSSDAVNSNSGPMSSSDTQKQSMGPSISDTLSMDTEFIGSDPENTFVLLSSQESVKLHQSKDSNEEEPQSVLASVHQPRLNSEATVIYYEPSDKKASSELSSQGSFPDTEFLEAVQHMEKQDEKARTICQERDKDFALVNDSSQEVKVSGSDVKNSNFVRDRNHNCSVVECNQNGAASSNSSSSNYVMPNSVQRKTYRLQDVYTRCFGHPPKVAHTAEDDCIALLKIVKKSTPQFLEWVDEHCVPFDTIPPMY